MNRVVTTVLAILIIFMLFFVISSKVSGGEPSIFGYQLKTVLSGSMEPTFKTGSVIAVTPLKDPAQLKKGDIITFKESEDMTITHRINNVVGSGKDLKFVTKGDNNNAPDENAVLPQNIEAVYTGFTIPYLGYVVNFAHTKTGFSTILFSGGFLLMLYSVITIWKAFKELTKPLNKESLPTTNDETEPVS